MGFLDPDAASRVCRAVTLLACLSLGSLSPLCAVPHALANETANSPQAAVESTPVLVRLGDFSLSLSDFESLWNRLSPETRQHYESPGGGGKHGFLQDFIRKKLIALEAEKLGLANQPETRLTLAVSRDTILYQDYVRQQVSERIGEDKLKAYYNEHQADFTVPLRVHVRHIVVTPRAEKPITNLEQDDATDEATAAAKLTRIQRALAEGGNFAQLAQKLSEDRSAASGGDLGFVEPGQLLADLDRVAFSLKEGQVSEVVHSEQGYHLVYAEERQEAGVLPFEDVREDILDTLSLDVGKSVDEALDAKVAELRKSLPIEVKEELLDPVPTAPR